MANEVAPFRGETIAGRSSDTDYPAYYYVKTFDTDGEFVREIRVFGTCAADALAKASLELCADEYSLALPILHHSTH